MRLVLLLFFLFPVAFGKLKFVQIWFRHGERTPGHYLYFPGDDLNNVDYQQIAWPGELTKRGILEEFQLGQRLRKIYGEHFGDTYQPRDFHVYTGKDNRTSASAQAMFAGFLPPNEDQTWNYELKWQPVAQLTDESIDWVSLGAIDNCPVYGEAQRKSSEYAEVMDQMEKYDAELLQLVRNHADEPIVEAVKYNHVIDSLKVRYILQDDRLPYPEWARGYENRILNMSFLIHDAVVKVQNDSVGDYHNELVMSYFETHLQKNSTKGVFISGHDTNLVTIWESLRLDGHPEDIPNYGAHIAIEMHEPVGQLSIKFFLSMGFNQTRVELHPHFCSRSQNNDCTWDEFQRLVKKSRKPKSDWIFECQGYEKATEPVSALTGSMIVLLSILILSTIILGFTTFSYKRQLNALRDPERTRLL
ncbi:ACid Phosphatase family [Caenorhabditis elegans]|uniref:ACid Phosphatase family n=1 Tax=Caenorhabditis elegans TaxID=6239 RepID=Q19390_CAEEL|nr:ACid Phosphatase family [Caenorhabditis elegans]CCD69455.1 ACid Phosphatase family [Caenorhabditis elegans]|eukprot:NP_508977.1 ACid Phosphatase family [Caenorhabditis elegans]